VTIGVRAAISRALARATGATGATVCATIGTAVVPASVGTTISRTFTGAAGCATIGTAVGAARHTCRTAVSWSLAAFVVACFVQGGFGHG
jgi:hypothetical protein